MRIVNQIVRLYIVPLITEFPFTSTPLNIWTALSSTDFSSLETEDADKPLPIYNKHYIRVVDLYSR